MIKLTEILVKSFTALSEEETEVLVALHASSVTNFTLKKVQKTLEENLFHSKL